MKFLITGASSGLGKHLFEIFGGTPYTRQTSEEEFNKLKKDGVDIIIHAAFNPSKNIDSNNLFSYIQDNVFLTEKLLKIPHRKFIFISSVDIYPKDNKNHTEEEVIDINSVHGIYAVTKLMSESLVRELCPNFLILRCSALLGNNSRKNSLMKIIESDNPAVTVSPKSYFNYILHSDVADFIKLAIETNLQGIYNLTSSANITLSKVANLLKKKVNFGTHIYNAGNIDNTKITSIFPAFKKTSKEVLSVYLG